MHVPYLSQFLRRFPNLSEVSKSYFDSSYFLYWLSIVVRTCFVLCLAAERVGYGGALLVALGNAVKLSSDHLGSCVLLQ